MRLIAAAFVGMSFAPVCVWGAPPAPAAGWRDTGEATWYGPRHEGLRTSSGERFDSRKLTAAHATLPLGSWVRVTVQRTGRSVIVRINDREPPHGVRCIDLSKAAAIRLGIVGSGVADVVVEAVAPEEAAAQPVELAEAPAASNPADQPVHRRASRKAQGRTGHTVTQKMVVAPK